MRLIDADDLLKAFEALELMSGEYAESFTNMAGSRSMEIECAKDYIDNAKTIDAVPVVHAHWVPCEDEYEDEYKCSACGGTQFFAMTPQNEGWEYCPHCGAKMDERKTNEYSGE